MTTIEFKSTVHMVLGLDVEKVDITNVHAANVDAANDIVKAMVSDMGLLAGVSMIVTKPVHVTA